jgi:Skp family chaperone for outer membrane proteins
LSLEPRDETFKDKKKLEDGIRQKIAEIEASLTPEEKKLYDEYKVRPAYTEKMEELQKLAQKYSLEIEQVDDVIGFKHKVNWFQKSIELSEEYGSKRTNDAILTLCKETSLKAAPLKP